MNGTLWVSCLCLQLKEGRDKVPNLSEFPTPTIPVPLTSNSSNQLSLPQVHEWTYAGSDSSNDTRYNVRCSSTVPGLAYRVGMCVWGYYGGYLRGCKPHSYLWKVGSYRYCRDWWDFPVILLSSIMTHPSDPSIYSWFVSRYRLSIPACIQRMCSKWVSYTNTPSALRVLTESQSAECWWADDLSIRSVWVLLWADCAILLSLAVVLLLSPVLNLLSIIKVK